MQLPWVSRQHLDLDVAGLGDEFLDEDPVVAERRPPRSSTTGSPRAHFLVVPGDAHALAAAAGAGLDHHRVADLCGDLHRLVGVLDQAHVARHCARPGLLSDLLGGDLVAHRLDRALGRADEGDAGFLQRLGEFRVFADRKP
jgi:hypothetical protein